MSRVMVGWSRKRVLKRSIELYRARARQYVSDRETLISRSQRSRVEGLDIVVMIRAQWSCESRSVSKLSKILTLSMVAVNQDFTEVKKY